MKSIELQESAIRRCVPAGFPPSVSCFLLPASCLLLSAFCLLPSAHGSIWSRQSSGTMAWLHAVYFLNQQHGWVAGSGGTLLETRDGGDTWKKVLTLTRDKLDDVYFADERIGWLVAERDMLKLKTNDEARSYLLKTEDGGFSWRQVFLFGPDSSARNGRGSGDSRPSASRIRFSQSSLPADIANAPHDRSGPTRSHETDGLLC